MIGGGGPCPFFFNYISAFALQLRKSKEHFSHCSRLVLDNSRCVDVAAFLGAAPTVPLSISPRLPVGDFSQPLVGTSAFQVQSKLDNV
jgi:hypothetical protein